MKILIVQNDDIENLGLYEQYLKEKNIAHTVIHAYRLGPQDPFPPVVDYDAFIIGPTPISANDADKHPFLVKEWDILDKIIMSGKPCLAVCCGAQMLARRLGAAVKRSPEKEVGATRCASPKRAW